MSLVEPAGVWRRVRAAAGVLYRRRIRRDVLILMFHRIREADGTSESALASLLDYCAQNYHVITLSELAAVMRRGSGVPKNTMVLTFDDCTRDQFTLAAPALQARGLRGTFAVVGCTLVERCVPPLHWYLHLIERTTRNVVRFGFGSVLAEREWRLSTADGEAVAAQRSAPLADAILRREHALGLEMLAALGEALGVPQPDVSELFMTLEEVRSLASRGHEIAAHSLWHRDVKQPDQATWVGELHQDFALMSDLFGRRAHSYIYPFGYERSPRVHGRIREAGFCCAATTQWGMNSRHTDLYALRRIGVDSNTPIPLPPIY